MFKNMIKNTKDILFAVIVWAIILFFGIGFHSVSTHKDVGDDNMEHEYYCNEDGVCWNNK